MVRVKTNLGTYSGTTALDAIRKGFGDKARFHFFSDEWRERHPGAKIGMVELPNKGQRYVFVAVVIDIVTE